MRRCKVRRSLELEEGRGKRSSGRERDSGLYSVSVSVSAVYKALDARQKQVRTSKAWDPQTSSPHGSLDCSIVTKESV